MSDVDRELARADALLQRTRDRAVSQRSRRDKEVEFAQRLGRIAAADALIVVGAIVVGLIYPLGMMGALAVMALLVLATAFFAFMPVSLPATAETLSQVPLKALPSKTERWLETQRPALPAPVRSLVDSIGVKLETLSPQLATLNESEPAAAEVRKLLGEQLPELIKGYSRVPEPLRKVERNGLTPDQQLAQGLQLIDDEIAEMTTQIAQGDLDALATRGRYLQIRYKDDEIAG
ncbi:hypothetical protein P1X14_18575 [Sphingomonas sp. AOB5]|uniref:hypothetical protein n=1 Tax=Sphingomonas sp. AOB5 TaxID=3034017 RepID=UPI0023F68BD6|nr:hypothetical protein [Sphingomonas sp. AOB5]MDF7777272.1 hypothetical protein [Sphingomonas sp. AOB5]